MCKHITLTLGKNYNLYVRLVFSDSMSKMSFGHEIFFDLVFTSRRLMISGSGEFITDKYLQCYFTLPQTIAGGSTPLLGTKFLRWILPGKFL